jgi:hypothetical protein
MNQTEQFAVAFHAEQVAVLVILGILIMLVALSVLHSLTFFKMRDEARDLQRRVAELERKSPHG